MHGLPTHSVCMISYIASLLLVSLLFIAIPTPVLNFYLFLVYIDYITIYRKLANLSRANFS